MVKTTALIKTIRSIKHADRFNMNIFFDRDCPMCIAGHAIAANGKTWYDAAQVGHSNLARQILGLSVDEGYRLFYGNYYATKKDAINVLEYLRDTGKISWAESKGYKEKVNV